MNLYHNVVSKGIVANLCPKSPLGAEDFLAHFAGTEAGRRAHGASLGLSILVIASVALITPAVATAVSSAGYWMLPLAVMAALFTAVIIPSMMYGFIAVAAKRRSDRASGNH